MRIAGIGEERTKTMMTEETAATGARKAKTRATAGKTAATNEKTAGKKNEKKRPPLAVVEGGRERRMQRRLTLLRRVLGDVSAKNGAPEKGTGKTTGEGAMTGATNVTTGTGTGAKTPVVQTEMNLADAGRIREAIPEEIRRTDQTRGREIHETKDVRPETVTKETTAGKKAGAAEKAKRGRIVAMNAKTGARQKTDSGKKAKTARVSTPTTKKAVAVKKGKTVAGGARKTGTTGAKKKAGTATKGARPQKTSGTNSTKSKRRK